MEEDYWEAGTEEGSRYRTTMDIKQIKDVRFMLILFDSF